MHPIRIPGPRPAPSQCRTGVVRPPRCASAAPPPTRHWSRGAAFVAAAGGIVEQRTVDFANDRGEKLVGTLVLPTASSSGEASSSGASCGDARPLVPCVILAHGYMSSRESELLVRLATVLARDAGCASLRFDFSGNGDSEGRFRYGGYRDEAEEIRCAREWAESQGLRVSGLLGHSKSGTTALLYASKYGDIPRVVNLAGRFDVREGIERRLGRRVLQQLEEKGEVEMLGRSRARGEFTWFLTKADLTDRLLTDVGAACKAIPPAVRVLTVHGTDDADVPVKEASKFAAAIVSHELLIIEGGDHRFSGVSTLMQLAPAVTKFITGAL